MLLIATGWHSLAKVRLILLCTAGILAIAFAALTFSQQTQWKDDATVFATAHQLAPHNAPVAQNLANTYVTAAMQLQDEGRCSEAVPILDGVLRDYPDDWLAWAGLGVCYVQLNDLPKAEASLHRAADISRKPQVIQQWQELRAHMGLPSSAPAN
jgi:tetratricopeptide (TPR) repeat protein